MPLHNPQTLRDALRELVLAYGTLNEHRRPCDTPLSTPHAWALLELRTRGAMTVTALSERLHIDRTNVSRLCTKMETLGELERVGHPEDGRAKLVALTTKGARVAQGVDEASLGFFGELALGLDEDVEPITAALNALTKALRDAARSGETP